MSKILGLVINALAIQRSYRYPRLRLEPPESTGNSRISFSVIVLFSGYSFSWNSLRGDFNSIISIGYSDSFALDKVEAIEFQI